MVVDGNSPPRIDSVHFRPEQIRSGEPVRALVEASDPDGDSLSYGFLWKLNERKLSGGGQQPPLTGTHKGDLLTVIVTASDGKAQSEPFERSIRIGNQAPILTGLSSEPRSTITAGGRVTVTPRATDPDGDPLSFRYHWTVNDRDVDEEGPALDTRGLRRGDEIRVAVTASDGEERSARLQGPQITVENAAPVIVSTPEFGEAGDRFRYQVRAEDADGDRTLRFSLATAPPGMTIDSIQGEIMWKPGNEEGDFPVEVVVVDLQGGRATQQFEVKVGVGDAGGSR